MKTEKYSLISNNWIEEQISHHVKYRDSFLKNTDNWLLYHRIIEELELLKQQLIPYNE